MWLWLIFTYTVTIDTLHLGAIPKVFVINSPKEQIIIVEKAGSIFGISYPSFKPVWIVPEVFLPPAVNLRWKGKYIPVLSRKKDEVLFVRISDGKVIGKLRVDIQNNNYFSLWQNNENGYWCLFIANNIKNRNPLGIIGNAFSSNPMKSLIKLRIGCTINAETLFPTDQGFMVAGCASGLSYQDPSTEGLSDLHAAAIVIGLTGRVLHRFVAPFGYYRYGTIFRTLQKGFYLLVKPAMIIRDTVLWTSFIYKFNSYTLNSYEKFIKINDVIKLPIVFRVNDKDYILTAGLWKNFIYIFDDSLNLIYRERMFKKEVTPVGTRFVSMSYKFYFLKDLKAVVIFTHAHEKSRHPRGINYYPRATDFDVFILNFPFRKKPERIYKFKSYDGFGFTRGARDNEFFLSGKMEEFYRIVIKK